MEVIPISYTPGICSQSGLESLKPALYHRLILFNISKEAVGQPRSHFEFAIPQVMYGGTKMCEERSKVFVFLPFMTMIKEPNTCDDYAKTKAHDVVMDPQDEFHLEPWMAYPLGQSKFSNFFKLLKAHLN